jgi:hypothetical protein
MSPWWQAHSALHPNGAQLSLIIDRLWSPMFAAAIAVFAPSAGRSSGGGRPPRRPTVPGASAVCAGR